MRPADDPRLNARGLQRAAADRSRGLCTFRSRYTHPMPRLALLLLCLLLPACGATRHTDTSTPGDFALGITVLGARDAQRLPRAQRPVQYLLEADGVLRVAVGAGVDHTTYPPRVRRLSARQTDRLWSLVQAGDFQNADHPAHIDDLTAFRPTPRDGWALLDVSAAGQRSTLALRLEDDPAAAQVIDELAALAWIRP